MRVSQKLDYALRAAVLLAGLPEGELVAAGDIADRLGLPRRFVEQQVTALARAGVVVCRRGAAGGCALARPASEIAVREVVDAINGQVLDAPRQPDSASAEYWDTVSVALTAELSRTALSELAERQRELDAASTHMYYI